MIGVIVGALSVVVAARVLHCARHHRRGHRCGPHHHHHRRGLVGRLASLFDRLGVSDDQARQLRDAIDGFRRRTRDVARGEAKQGRSDLASALRADTLDEVLFGDMFSRHDDRMRELREALLDLVGRVHAVLDEGQRQRLADWLESRGAGHGPFRGAW